MRKGEILGLRWRDVDTVNKRIVIQETKNGERRGVPLVGNALKLLERLKNKKRGLRIKVVVPLMISYFTHLKTQLNVAP